MRCRGPIGPARTTLLVLAVAAVAHPVRADDPNLLERIASLKRSPDGTNVHLLDTPVFQALRVEDERSEEGQREGLRVAASPLFSLFEHESTSAAAGAVARSEGEGRFASLLGVSLLEWRSEKELLLGGSERSNESEWRFLTLPRIGSLFSRKKTEEGSSYEILFFLNVGGAD